MCMVLMGSIGIVNNNFKPNFPNVKTTELWIKVKMSFQSSLVDTRIVHVFFPFSLFFGCYWNSSKISLNCSWVDTSIVQITPFLPISMNLSILLQLNPDAGSTVPRSTKEVEEAPKGASQPVLTRRAPQCPVRRRCEKGFLTRAKPSIPLKRPHSASP